MEGNARLSKDEKKCHHRPRTPDLCKETKSRRCRFWAVKWVHPCLPAAGRRARDGEVRRVERSLATLLCCCLDKGLRWGVEEWDARDERRSGNGALWGDRTLVSPSSYNGAGNVPVFFDGKRMKTLFIFEEAGRTLYGGGKRLICVCCMLCDGAAAGKKMAYAERMRDATRMGRAEW
ncbi:hypothetical protein K402DRAFT_158286 [Aulographum hederae CBS 113979]|uniref:Uncharacterized protein n=1 Tax=Aulographum hederae CBS 113979 TaxID=1176131 RepID=A0A6G1GSH9_9PEZI|nr:hypothetical protein K402DRAFT_158286 [Aulographum hederae CBS 113979]